MVRRAQIQRSQPVHYLRDLLLVEKQLVWQDLVHGTEVGFTVYLQTPSTLTVLWPQHDMATTSSRSWSKQWYPNDIDGRPRPIQICIAPRSIPKGKRRAETWFVTKEHPLSISGLVDIPVIPITRNPSQRALLTAEGKTHSSSHQGARRLGVRLCTEHIHH